MPAVTITPNLLFQVEDEPYIAKRFRHHKFAAYSSYLGELQSVALLIGEMHYLILNQNLTREEQQKLVETHWREEFIPCRTAILGADVDDTEEEQELSQKYHELLDQMLAADAREMRRNLLAELDRIVAKKVFRGIKNSYLAGLKDQEFEG
jgi:hypothetical protein